MWWFHLSLENFGNFSSVLESKGKQISSDVVGSRKYDYEIVQETNLTPSNLQWQKKMAVAHFINCMLASNSPWKYKESSIFCNNISVANDIV